MKKYISKSLWFPEAQARLVPMHCVVAALCDDLCADFEEAWPRPILVRDGFMWVTTDRPGHDVAVDAGHAARLEKCWGVMQRVWDAVAADRITSWTRPLGSDAPLTPVTGGSRKTSPRAWWDALAPMSLGFVATPENPLRKIELFLDETEVLDMFGAELNDVGVAYVMDEATLLAAVKNELADLTGARRAVGAAMALWAYRNGRREIGRVDWGEVTRNFVTNGGSVKLDANMRRVFVFNGERVSEKNLGEGVRSVKKRVNKVLKTAS